MQTAPHQEVTAVRRGLPRWSLLAAVPVVLAVGFVTGVALSAYRPAPPLQVARQEPGTEAPPDSAGGDVTTGGPGPSTHPAPSPGEGSSPSPERPPTWANPLPHPVDEPLPYTVRSPGLIDPGPHGGGAGNAGLPPARTLVEARALLTARFQRFDPGDGRGFSVDYQVARDMNYNTLLIGIIKIEEYGEWVRAAREYPAALKSWLEAAARSVKDAALNEKFTLTWTIFETVSEPPFGFSAREVTPDPRGGGYVVTRPLAAVTDPSVPAVTIAAVETEPSRPASADSPWSAYGPVLRFDPTDLYRPARAGRR